jgi:hypothetical protein
MSIWDEFKTDLGRDLKFVIVAVTIGFGLSLCSDAKAQTVQPSYTRPSKGAVLTVFNAPQNTAITTTTVYDWSAFTATAPAIKFAKADGTGCACPAGHKCFFTFTYTTEGSAVKTGPFVQLDTFSAPFPVSGTAAQDAYVIAPTNAALPFVRFATTAGTFIDVTAAAPIATPCYLTVNVTPIPFTYRNIVDGPAQARTRLVAQTAPTIGGGSDYVQDANGDTTAQSFRVNENGVLAVGGGAGIPILPTAANYGSASPFTVAASPAAATKVWEFAGVTMGYRHGVRLENVGAQAVYCAAGEDSSSVTLTNYAFSLKKPAAAGDGSGGTMDIPQMNVSYANGDSAKVYCIGPVAGASSVAVMPY